jgi:hypothetical protein
MTNIYKIFLKSPKYAQNQKANQPARYDAFLISGAMQSVFLYTKLIIYYSKLLVKLKHKLRFRRIFLSIFKMFYGECHIPLNFSTSNSTNTLSTRPIRHS